MTYLADVVEVVLLVDPSINFVVLTLGLISNVSNIWTFAVIKCALEELEDNQDTFVGNSGLKFQIFSEDEEDGI